MSKTKLVKFFEGISVPSEKSEDLEELIRFLKESNDPYTFNAYSIKITSNR